MRVRSFVLSGVLSGLAALHLAPALPAQERRLEWPQVAVTAHLDSAGRLHVREAQTIRYTGDWNGGERQFDLRWGQELALHALTRLDSGETGEGRALRPGGLARVDDYEWVDATLLRWRGRLPEDPPFDGVLRTYTLVYSYGNILRAREDARYLLDHDFGIGTREAPIGRYTLRLTLDPAWRADRPMPLELTLTDVAADSGVVLSIPLHFIAAGQPSSVRRGTSAANRKALVITLLAFAVVALLRTARHDARLGRFRPIPDHRSITPEWLATHLFSMLPEAAGAAIDEHTSAPEVAATLARLVQEGKLSSRIEQEKVWIFSSETLHLQLEVPRGQLKDHERSLIDGLFRPHETSTDTTRVRKRYKKTGFDPARLIKAQLEQRIVDATAGPTATPSGRLTIGLALAALLCIGIGAARHPDELPFGLLAVGIGIGGFIAGAIGAFVYKVSARTTIFTALFVVLPVAAIVAAFAVAAITAPAPIGLFTWLGAACWAAALINSIANTACTSHSAERVALRQRLMAARRYFVEELKTASPRLQDDWYPYLIAFGLGRSVDKWFRAFGGASAARASTARVAGTASRMGGSSAGGGWTGFSGGGGFSGAGAGASFASAVGGMAASVPAPSSSSGGSRGGGGSSGGGRSGGW